MLFRSIADAHADLADVLLAADKPEAAQSEFQRALDLYERKGHLVGSARMRARQEELAGATPA